MALVNCPCGQTNRVPALMKTRMKCGACKREFKPSELARATPEAPPKRVGLEDMVKDFEMESEDDGPGSTWVCQDECGWEGEANELDLHQTCPECGHKAIKADDFDALTAGILAEED